MAAPEIEVMSRVQALVAAVYATEGWTARRDKLLRADGKDGATHLAVYPENASRNPQLGIELIVPVVFQLHLPFPGEPDETRQVDPTAIVELAERFRTAFDPAAGANDSIWFLRLEAVRYPDDPTGKKSRFEALIHGRGQNEPELPETTA